MLGNYGDSTTYLLKVCVLLILAFLMAELSYRYECWSGHAREILRQDKFIIRSSEGRRMVIDVKHRDKESCCSAVAFTILVGSHYIQLEL